MNGDHVHEQGEHHRRLGLNWPRIDFASKTDYESCLRYISVSQRCEGGLLKPPLSLLAALVVTAVATTACGGQGSTGPAASSSSLADRVAQACGVPVGSLRLYTTTTARDGRVVELFRSADDTQFQHLYFPDTQSVLCKNGQTVEVSGG